ncbi:LrgB family protein [Pseudomonas sp. R3.Fl]|uniref:LrgB family protein n=1 Tax=Pseudomonas TaxID=286 RepID=UPI00201DA19A|nr:MULTISPECIES: LrgB family protein [Pseudomonas]MCL6691445.1 LrgB family protein [Pseudomonas sp. R3.Fl]UUC49253.1 LrgB family protein [Pseudomonas citronellolis]UXJ53888.1 LrgB family protein [Pseudomonas citronellolis]
MSLDKQALFWLALTLGGYLFSRQLYKRVRWYGFAPIVFVPALLFAVAIPLHAHYADYSRDTNWLVALLGPATVAFAVPIWQQRALLARHWPALLVGMCAGSAVAIGSSWMLANALALDGQVALSLVPRSITTPLAMEMSHDLGGVPELTAAFVMITGVFGALAGGLLMKLLPLRSTLARGALLGVGAHGAGTSRAYEFGGEEGSTAGLLMVLTGLFNLLLAPAVALVL